LLQRFIAGGGKLWDLEFLNNDQGRRVAAFGRSAGAVGMALGYWMWANKVNGAARPLEPMTKPYSDYKALAVDVKHAVDAAAAKIGRYPRVIIIGALGRCGAGAIEFSTLINAPDATLTKWDLEETRPGGPFPQILEHDIMLNCIYLSQPIPPFINRELIEATPSRKLTSIVDVSCDASNPHNPIPLYNTYVEAIERFFFFSWPIVLIC
jgi:saccharopine dehydrogenase (NAD+, L-lysine forming)